MKTWHFFLAFGILSFSLLAYCSVFTALAEGRMEASERTVLLQCIEDPACDYAKTQGQLELHRESAPWQSYALVASLVPTVIALLCAIITKPYP